MPLPEGWEWLDEIPDEWDPPAELAEPTGLPRVNLPIIMLSSDALGNDLIDLVGQLLSEGARFNMWFAREAKTKAESPKELALLSLACGEQLRRVYAAWTAFITARRAAGAREGAFDAERRGLREALINAIKELAKARTR